MTTIDRVIEGQGEVDRLRKVKKQPSKGA